MVEDDDNVAPRLLREIRAEQARPGPLEQLGQRFDEVQDQLDARRRRVSDWESRT